MTRSTEEQVESADRSHPASAQTAEPPSEAKPPSGLQEHPQQNRRQSILGYLSVLLALAVIAGGVVRLVISEMRMKDALIDAPPAPMREEIAYWATMAPLVLAPAAVGLALLAIWWKGKHRKQTAARVGLAMGFWAGVPLWIYEILVWLGWIK